MNQAIFNPFAPAYLNGFNQQASAPDGCDDVDAAIVWPTNGDFQLLAGRQAMLGNVLVLEQEDEFVFRAFQWSLFVANPQSGFLYRIQDDAGNWISDGFVFSFNTAGTFANPCPIFPHVTYRRGQQIKFDLINASLDPQGFQLVLRGVRRYFNKRR